VRAKNAAATASARSQTGGIPSAATIIAIRINGNEKIVCESITSSEKCLNLARIFMPFVFDLILTKKGFLKSLDKIRK
jgi:hypothetical protein